MNIARDMQRCSKSLSWFMSFMSTKFYVQNVTFNVKAVKLCTCHGTFCRIARRTRVLHSPSHWFWLGFSPGVIDSIPTELLFLEGECYSSTQLCVISNKHIHDMSVISILVSTKAVIPLHVSNRGLDSRPQTTWFRARIPPTAN